MLERRPLKASQPPEMSKRHKPSHEAAHEPSHEASDEASDEAAASDDAPRAAGAAAVNAGLLATASRVQEMHEIMAGNTFDHLLGVPGLSMPTRLAQTIHDAISHGVYAAVRQGGAVGDALTVAANPLAVQMSLHARGVPLEMLPATLAPLRSRVCVFIHGMACDEGSWGPRTSAWAGSAWEHALPADQAARYGDLLEHEPLLPPVSAVYLRYNTGLPIEANAQQLAALLGDLLRTAPQVRELVLVGHSMGGLVARRALAIAASEGMPWAACAATVICLGSPHQGAGLAGLGDIAGAVLMASDVTRSPGRIGDARSDPPPQASPVPLRLVYATLGDAADAAASPGGAFMGKLFGDGLVHAASAADDGLTGDVQRVEIAGLGHMRLLSDPRVYALIRRWLGAPELA